MKRILWVALLSVLWSAGLWSQASPAQCTSDSVVCAYLYQYSGSSLTAVCSAPVGQTPATWSVAASTLTSVAVAANVGTATFASAPGLWQGAQLTLTGGPTGLAASYAITGVSGTTVTIATSGVSNGTYTTGIAASSTSPLTGAAQWNIQLYAYNGSGQVVASHWAGGNRNFTSVCANWASY